MAVQAQDQMVCMPDTTMLSDTVIISPLPFDSITRPTGGITDTACLNTPYETIISLVVPSTVGTIPINSISVATEDAVNGLPEGLSYECNPPTCEFPADEFGCIRVFGTPTNEANIGKNVLQLDFTIRSVIAVPLSFPDNTGLLPESAAGEYSIYVDTEDGQSCGVPLSTKNSLSNVLSMKNRPNPFSDLTTIDVQAQISGDFQFSVFNMVGQMVHQQKVQLVTGQNSILFSGAHLATGMYTFAISNNQGVLTDKMLISRR